MARLSSELVLTLTDRVSGPAKGVGRAVDRLDDRMARSGRLHAAEAASMARAAPMMLAGAASVMAPLAAGLGGQAIVTAAADFESAMTGIQKLAGTTAAETAALGEEIKALATSGDLAVSIEDIASAYARGAAAGLPIASLKEFATISAKAADAFGMSAEDVGNFAAKLKTSLGATDEEVRKIFDLTNSLADAGIADESKIIDFMDRMGASLKTLGLNSGQSLALGSTLLNIGMTAETGATAMDAMTSKLLTVGQLSGKKKNAFEKFIGPVGTFAKMVEKDANGALLHLLDTVKGLKGADRMAFLTEFVGQDHASKVLRLSDAVGEYRRNLELANDESRWFGSLDASYKLKLDDFWSQWQIVKSALAELMIDTGTMGMPAFKAALEGAQAIIKEIDAGLTSFRATVNTEELASAMKAIGDLGSAISGLMNMKGSEGSPIEKFFDRLATSANAVTSGINIGKDVLQAVGLVEADDDTPEDRAERRTSLKDDLISLHPLNNPVARGVADATGITEWFNRTPEASQIQSDDARREWLRNFERSNAAYHQPVDLPRAPQAKGGRATAADPSRFGGDPVPAGGDLSASMAALAAAMADLASKRGDAVASSTSTAPVGTPAVLNPPKPEARPYVITPTARPDIVGPVTAEGEAAVTAAEAIGTRISGAFNVTASPTIDTSSITSAKGKVDALAAALRQISTLAERANTATQSVKSPRLDMGGLHRGD